jgi:hypothetical protein
MSVSTNLRSSRRITARVPYVCRAKAGTLKRMFVHSLRGYSAAPKVLKLAGWATTLESPLPLRFFFCARESLSIKSRPLTAHGPLHP